jgi:hypothetical protein
MAMNNQLKEYFMSTLTNPFSTVFSTLTDDAKAQLLGLITQAHANIAANPTTQTVVAQYAVATLSAPSLLPTLETDAINAINNALLAAATSVLAAPVVAPAPLPEPASAVASSTSGSGSAA